MSGNPRSPRIRARRAATTAEILGAAWTLAREHGLVGFSMRALADAVGMRAQSLYEYFPSKHALYDAMFRAGNEAFLELQLELDRTTGDESDLRAEAQRRLRGFFDFCVDDPVRHQLLFLRTIPDFEPTPASYAIAREAYDVAVAGLRRAGFDESTIDLTNAIASGLVAQQLANDPGGDRWERLIDPAVDVILATRSKATRSTTSSRGRRPAIRKQETDR